MATLLAPGGCFCLVSHNVRSAWLPLQGLNTDQALGMAKKLAK